MPIARPRLRRAGSKAERANLAPVVEFRRSVEFHGTYGSMQGFELQWGGRMPGDLIRREQHNIGHICTRQVCDDGFDARVAMRWVGSKGESRDYTFADLEREANRAANALASLGLSEGDVVFTFLPKRPELFFALLGALKLRLVTGTLFSNFGEDALRDRLGPSRAQAIVTQQSLLHKVLRARAHLPGLRHVLVLDAPGDDASVRDFEAMTRAASPEFTAPRTSATAPSVLHFTSGSTGKPKGALHVHGRVPAPHRARHPGVALR